MSDFGMCDLCFEPVDDPLWDRICDDCREEEAREDDERRGEMMAEDNYLYGIPWGEATALHGAGTATPASASKDSFSGGGSPT